MAAALGLLQDFKDVWFMTDLTGNKFELEGQLEYDSMKAPKPSSSEFYLPLL